MNWKSYSPNPWRLGSGDHARVAGLCQIQVPWLKRLKRLLTVGFSGSGSDDKETVEVQRRRRTESTGPRRRAEAPKRERDDGGGGTPPPAAQAAQVAALAHRPARPGLHLAR